MPTNVQLQSCHQSEMSLMVRAAEADWNGDPGTLVQLSV